MKFLAAIAVLSFCLAFTQNTKACNPATAAAFQQAAFTPMYGSSFSSFSSMAVAPMAVAVPFAVATPVAVPFAVPSVGFHSFGFAASPFVGGVGGGTIIQSGRRNVIRGGGFGASAAFGGGTIIQSGRRNRIR